MEVTEQQRHQLFVWFEEQMGPERAATMMNLIPPVGWFELASKHDLLELERRLDHRFESIDHRFESIDLRFESLESRIDGKLESLESRIDGKVDRLRSDLMRTLGTWLFASQAAVISSLGLLITLR